DGMVTSVASLLNDGGSFVIQTLHPVAAGGDEPYQDGWRKGSWAGFSEDFTDPAPWYFRTIEGWIRLIGESGLTLADLREPVHPITGKPASLILIAEASK
ncbi:MAG: class I SAM-dependent methyltransferase, partial [Gemmatimonadales bacterium]